MNGTWFKLNDKDDYKFYSKLSNWCGQVLCEKTVNIDKLKDFKFYAKNNQNKEGLVRDHMFGRKSGFLNNVFPEIIKHPANCQLLSHGENIKKSKKNNDSIIELDELFDRIKNWDSDYQHQEKCIRLIELYVNGYRYDKQKYIDNYFVD